MDISEEARTRRTKTILDAWRGNPREFDHLHGILCIAHGWKTDESIEMDQIIDNMAIAERLDEMNNIALGRIPDPDAKPTTTKEAIP